jgi:hypothetical protein
LSAEREIEEVGFFFESQSDGSIAEESIDWGKQQRGDAYGKSCLQKGTRHAH